MKLLLDMNIPSQLCVRLREAGWETIHWADVGDPKAADAVLMDWARRNGHVVVTHDLDFSAILASIRGSSPSVIQIRAQDVLSERFVAILIESLLQFGDMLEDGAIVVVEESGTRARALPLKS
jgi:predicted nuclease of predicted toxin-antitoxin system